VPLKIPEDVKAAVRRDWLNGKPRDTIARDNSLSTGSVSSIISELRNDLTRTDADALRELRIMLTKSGISASECALGFNLLLGLTQNIMSTPRSYTTILLNYTGNLLDNIKSIPYHT
jgi:hypothetical protein